MPLRIHDLLEIDAERFLHAHSSVPPWVAESLRQTPFVVVRRGAVSGQEIPVGVRGAHRNERWAGGCHPGLVNEILTPQALLSRAAAVDVAATATTRSCPALRTLALLTQRWKALDSPWGPGGSVGFELATNRHVVTLQSDLDVVIYAHRQISVNEARALRDSTQGLPAPVDIRVETPTCGFSLAEYASRAPAPILLRNASGVFLGADPWETQDATGAPQHVTTQPATDASIARHR
jgi:phosphoribosyl-dephospho-CoA transferase